jgi:hypothetical protein
VETNWVMSKQLGHVNIFGWSKFVGGSNLFEIFDRIQIIISLIGWLCYEAKIEFHLKHQLMVVIILVRAKCVRCPCGVTGGLRGKCSGHY